MFKGSNKWGDNMNDYIWDGPEDPDKELEEIAVFKNDYEKEMGIKYCKNGLIDFLEKLLEKESI